jgi:WD40 repeat protein
VRGELVPLRKVRRVVRLGHFVVRAWDVASGSCAQILSGHTNDVCDVAWEGVLIASESLDSTVRIWTCGVCVATLRSHAVGQVAVAWEDERRLWVAAMDVFVRRGRREGWTWWCLTAVPTEPVAVSSKHQHRSVSWRGGVLAVTTGACYHDDNAAVGGRGARGRGVQILMSHQSRMEEARQKEVPSSGIFD